MGWIRKRKRINKRKCIVCKRYFLPDYRNKHHQKACSSSECQRTRHAISHRKWLSKPANRDYWKGSSQTNRVQQMRSNKPHYWTRTKRSKPLVPLQDTCFLEAGNQVKDRALKDRNALQDLLMEQHAVTVGIKSLTSGSTLQDDIGQQRREIIQRGLDVLRPTTGPLGALDKPEKEPNLDQKTSPMPATSSSRSRTFQLAGPPPSPG